MQLKSILAVTALAVSSASSFAQTIRTFDLGSSFGSPTLYASFSQTVPLGAFLDTYTFGVTGQVAAIATVTNVFFTASGANHISFASILLDSTPLVLSSVTTAGQFGNTSITTTLQTATNSPPMVLNAGTHTLRILGVSDNPFGTSYAGNFALVPVPEPASYALMLAGLGVVGFFALRRKAF